MPTTGSKPDQPTNFGAWVRAQREGRGWTQAHLAEHVACAERTLRAVEAGTRLPSAQLADLLLEVFKVPEDQQRAYRDWARGGLAPEREGGPAVFVQETVAAVERAVQAILAEQPGVDPDRLAAIIQQAVDVALTAHGTIDPAALEASVAQALRAELAAFQARQATHLRAQLVETLGPTLAQVQEQLEVRRAVYAWRQWMTAWYRVHVKEQVAAAALMALLMHGFPVPFEPVVRFLLGLVMAWATVAVFYYWRLAVPGAPLPAIPAPVSAMDWAQSRELMRRLGARAVAWPVGTLGVVLLVLTVGG